MKQKKEVWDFSFGVQNIDEKDAEKIGNAFIAAVEKVKGYAGGGYHKLNEKEIKSKTLVLEK